MAKKSIIAIVVVVIVVIVAAIAIAGSDDSDPDLRYDYTLSYAESVGDVLPDYPDEGYVFLIVNYTEANDSDDNLSTNAFFQTWQAELDGIVYSTDEWVSASMPGHDTREFAPGATISDCVAIQVPVGHDLSEFAISLDYDLYGVETAFDDTLIP